MRTTININTAVYKKIKYASDELKISTNSIIAMLIEMVRSKDGLKVKALEGVKYQGKDPWRNWKKLHVTFQKQTYEKGLDLRKFLKLSVSFVISFAVVHYLNELITKLSNNQMKMDMDNYPINYIFIAQSYGGIQGFIVFWGIPEEKIQKTLIG